MRPWPPALERLAPAVALLATYGYATLLSPAAGIPGDLGIYGDYAERMTGGALPFRDFSFEYPPLAAVPIALAGSVQRFAVAMLLVALAIQWLSGSLAGPRAAWALVAFLGVLGPISRSHFDAVPVAIVAGAMLAFARQRPRVGFALLGVGVATKLYPVVLVVVAVAWLWGRGERREAGIGAGVVALVCTLAFVPFAGHGLLDAGRFHLDRPVQIESVPATVLFTLGDPEVTGAPVRPDRFRSNGVAGGPAPAVQAVFTAALVVALAGCVVLAAGGGDVRRLVLVCFLALLAFVALGKVLSPQYLIWLAPFAAVAFAWRMWAPAALTLVAACLTAVEYPSRYARLVAEHDGAILLVAVRNGLLLAAAAALVVALTRRAAVR